jgi:hypothetical protein
MHGLNKRFINNKRAFLDKHLVLYAVEKALGRSNTGQELPVFEFDLRPMEDIINETGHVFKACELRKIGEWVGFGRTGHKRKIGFFTHPLRAYFLPWGSGKTYRGRLGVQADVFFTPTMNGCTFAAEGFGLTPLVAHSNFVNPTTTMVDQGLIDNDINGYFGTSNPAIHLIKNAYKRPAIADEDYAATVIGLRIGGGWQFFYQNYKVEPGAKFTALSMCTPL